jgi:hypothetical protein
MLTMRKELRFILLRMVFSIWETLSKILSIVLIMLTMRNELRFILLRMVFSIWETLRKILSIVILYYAYHEE